MIRRALVACAALALFFYGCADPEPIADIQAAVDDARVRWGQAGITSYRFTIEWSCFCPPTHATVEVSNGEIGSIVSLTGGSAAAVLGLTIEGLFDEIESAAAGSDSEAGHPGAVTAVFDSDYGYPVSVSADPILEAVDDEFGWEITGFVALQGAIFERADAPAGIHECALLMRGEVDSVLGAGTPLGDFSTPAVTISICTWSGADSSLVLTLFPTPDGGLLVPYPDAIALKGSEGVLVEQFDGASLVVVDVGGTVIALESSVADPSLLAELLMSVAGRLP